MLLLFFSTKTKILGRFGPLLTAHPSLVVDGVWLVDDSLLVNFGKELEKKLTLETHLLSLISSASRKLGIVKRAFCAYGNQAVSSACCRSYLLPLLKYTPVWGSAAIGHLLLLDAVATRELCGASFNHVQAKQIVGSKCITKFGRTKSIRSMTLSLLHMLRPGVERLSVTSTQCLLC